MKKGIISTIIGLPIGVIAGYLLYCHFFAYDGFGPLFIDGTFDMIYGFAGPLIFPLLIIGLVLGAQSLRSKKIKIISYMGIITNLVGLLIGVFVLTEQPIKEYFYERGLTADREIQGIFFPKGTRIKYDSSGKLSEVELIKDQNINGLILSKEWRVEFWGSGKIKACRLAEDREIQSIKFLKGTDIHFDESGKLGDVYLHISHDIRGMKCIKSVHFYGSGELSIITLADDQKIQGISFSKETDIVFEKSGKISYVTLGAEQKINDTRYRKGQRLRFRNDGSIELLN